MRRIAAPGTLLHRRLEGHATDWARPLAIARIPYGHRVWRAPQGPDWLWHVGDQAAVTPSFTGDGMALALASARVAAGAILAGASPAAGRAALRARLGRQMAVAGALAAPMRRAALHRPIVAGLGLAPPLASALARATRLPAPP